MNTIIFSAVDKQLLRNSPIFNKAVKSFESASNNSNQYPSDSVSIVCNYEGTIRFINPSFSKIGCEPNQFLEKSILDFIHPEDVYPVIEHLVLLLQETTESVVLGARFLCKENNYYFTKWHVSYLRGLFYLYPLEVPEIPTAENHINQNFKNVQTKNSGNNKNSEQLIWKMELSKTLYEWDRLILKQVKYCLSV
ncbi:PAS domain-containing protein [uncultured Planktosalinus sp.]|uniref:PAS domain-containing protein n=1 Tax=uncultured Planktosalinus sp. TaxID=1810935 RepID=UPI0030DB50F1